MRPLPAVYIYRPAVVCCVKAIQEKPTLKFVQRATSVTLIAVPAVAPRATNVFFESSRYYVIRVVICESTIYLPQCFPATIDVVRGENKGLQLTDLYT
jgi:hypothetical protein